MASLDLVVFYVLFFGSVGVTLPWLPAWFDELGFGPSRVGLLLALHPLAMMLCPPFWGAWADRSGRPDRVLRVLAFGAACAFFPLLWVRSYAATVACVAAYAVFVSSITPTLDAVALRSLNGDGGAYARIRLFGSVGFVVTTFAFGHGVSAPGVRVIQVAWGFMFAYALWSLRVRARAQPARAAHPLAALGLLKDGSSRQLLVACAAHWVACAPYHGSFARLVKDRALEPSVVGDSVGTGVAAELAVMAAWPLLGGRWSTRTLLVGSFLLSGVRWAAVALVTDPRLLVALQLLHGFTFAAFYLAAVSEVTARVAPELRASGQALFAAFTFGLGGCVGFVASGSVLEWAGSPALFGAAAVLEGMAALAVAGVASRIAAEARPSAAP
jgi:PPP family 3-phenylpropionic acid transporter